MKVNIIGGGLAGCALAYVLKNAGAEPVIYEAGNALASGASGNDVGLYNPRFCAEYNAVAEFYEAAFREALNVFSGFGDAVNFDQCGALHLITNDKKAVQYNKMLQSWRWEEGDMCLVSAQEASDIAGVEVDYDCLHLPQSGKVSPKKLCHAYAQGVDVHLNTPIENLNDLDGDVTVLACGVSSLAFESAQALPLSAVRGQVTYVRGQGALSNLKAILCYRGSVSPSVDGVHSVGSTFQRWLDHADVLADDDVANLGFLFDAVPALKGVYTVEKSWAGLRTASRDYFPVVGQLSEGVYISSAHGSHGLLSTLLSANTLSNTILKQEATVSNAVLSALSPQRFK